MQNELTNKLPEEHGVVEHKDGSLTLPVVAAIPTGSGTFPRVVFRQLCANYWPVATLLGMFMLSGALASQRPLFVMSALLQGGLTLLISYILWQSWTALDVEGITHNGLLPRRRVMFRWEDIASLRSAKNGVLSIVARNGQAIEFSQFMPTRYWQSIAKRLISPSPDFCVNQRVLNSLPRRGVWESAFPYWLPWMATAFGAAAAYALGERTGNVPLWLAAYGAYLLFEVIKGKWPERAAKVLFDEEGITVKRGRSERRMLWRDISVIHCFNSENVLLLGDRKAELLRGTMITKAIMNAAEGRISSKALFRAPA